MKTITWLHLSDLHYCEPKHGWDATQILEDLRTDFERMRDDHGLCPDLIFFTGDAAFGQIRSENGWSIAEQFIGAEVLFEEIRSIFSPVIAKENFFIVPGNHDVNRSEIPEPTVDWLDNLATRGFEHARQKVADMMQKNDKNWKTYMERLQDYRKFLGDWQYEHLLQYPDYLIYGTSREIRGITVGIAGLNSAWSSGRDGEKGKLWLGGHWQVQKLRPHIKNALIRIGLMHHPLSWLGEAEDPGLTPELERNFGFLLHGHEHHSWVTELPNHVRIAAGACYGSSEQESGYSFVRIDPESNAGEIWLRRYEAEGGGWIPRVIANRTDDKGRWPLTMLPGLLAATRPASFMEKIKPAAPSPQPLTGPESRGVFGREQEIHKIITALGQSPIITLYGMPGIGKSSLVREVRNTPDHKARDYVRFRLYADTTLAEAYRQIAPILGAREEYLEVPEAFRNGNFSYLRRFQNASCFIHLDMAHELFAKRDQENIRDIKQLLEAITEFVPEARVILESRAAPPPDLFPPTQHQTFKIRGLDQESVRAYFRHPFRNDQTKGWDLAEPEVARIYNQLGGSRKNQQAHPLAMFLLATVAEGQNTTPADILKKYPDTLATHLENELFNDLYDRVLSETERRMLRLCALYRDGIPDSHVDKLNTIVGDRNAFDYLVTRCLLTPDDKEEWYYLHSIIAAVTLRRMETQSEQLAADHEHIADAWLEQGKAGNRASLPNIRAASEAVHHLIRAERFDRLAGLANHALWGNLIPQLETVYHNLYLSGRYKDEQYVLELLVAVDPENSKAHRYLGDAIERVEGIGGDEALSHYVKAYEIDPSSSSNLGCIARSLLARQESDKYVEMVRKFDRRTFSRMMDVHNLSMYCRSLARLANKEDASRLRQEAIDSGVLEPQYYIDEALYLRNAGRQSDALALLDHAHARGIANAAVKDLRRSIENKLESR